MSSSATLTPDAILREVAGAVAASDLRRAMQFADLGLARGMRHRILFNARGLALQASGLHQQAIDDFRRSLTLAPGDPGVLNAIGLSLIALGRFGEAAACFDEAIQKDPKSPNTYHRKGLALMLTGQFEPARDAYNKALALDENHAGALANLASLEVRSGNPDSAASLAKRALAVSPDDFTANCVVGIIDLRKGRFADLEKRLPSLIARSDVSPYSRAGVMSLLGDALDGQGRYGEAFAIYRSRNEDIRNLVLPQFAQGHAIDAATNLIRYFETAPAGTWRKTQPYEYGDGAPAQHVFLLGFMRSGTTLLEQTLASNPQVVALEEKGTLDRPSATYMTSEIGLELLAGIGGRELAAARANYWNEVRKLGIDPAGRIILDKQPLNTVKLPLIAKLFPDAKILFALRDPRDVVFSCFRRHFAVNATTFAFLSLEDAATFYSSVMRLAELYRDKLTLNLHEHRYEAMVDDLEGTMRAVCDFIGLEWTDTMRNFERSRSVADLRSPSAIQVTRPLFSEGVAQWRRYGEQLAPVRPILAPWVEKFGYPAD